MANTKQHMDRPFTTYEQDQIFDSVDDLRNAVRFSLGSHGYKQSCGEAEILLRRAIRRLNHLIDQ
jgi:hypothetical protein